MSAHVPLSVRLFTPVAKRLLAFGLPQGPNALLTVIGRKSGEPRTTGVTLVALDGRRWVIGTFGETNWVRNLRAAGRATLTVGRKREDITAQELTAEARTAFFRDVLVPYVRRMAIGGVLLAVLGARDILSDPTAAAAKRPVFELHAAGRLGA
jgi:deazaflavin-dependent oxidoreductase (nitroreductase family)